LLCRFNLDFFLLRGHGGGLQALAGESSGARLRKCYDMQCCGGQQTRCKQAGMHAGCGSTSRRCRANGCLVLSTIVGQQEEDRKFLIIKKQSLVKNIWGDW
jgi:hypothetical protein